jgi:hypothetical protein
LQGFTIAARQHRQFLVAADERRAGRTQCLEAAFGATLAQHPQSHERRGQALDLDRAEIA